MKVGARLKSHFALFILIGIIFIASCTVEKNSDDMNNIDEVKIRFEAIILENNDSYLSVEPVEGEMELRSADIIHVSISDALLLDEEGNETTIDTFKEDMHVDIEYNGMIAESYPAQIHTCYEVKILP